MEEILKAQRILKLDPIESFIRLTKRESVNLYDLTHLSGKLPLENFVNDICNDPSERFIVTESEEQIFVSLSPFGKIVQPFKNSNVEVKPQSVREEWLNGVYEYVASRDGYCALSQAVESIHLKRDFQASEAIKSDPLKRFILSVIGSTTFIQLVSKTTLVPVSKVTNDTSNDNTQDIANWKNQIYNHLKNEKYQQLELFKIIILFPRPSTIHKSIRLFEDILILDTLKRFDFFMLGSEPMIFNKYELNSIQMKELINDWLDDIYCFLLTQPNSFHLLNLRDYCPRPFSVPHSVRVTNVLEKDSLKRFIITQKSGDVYVTVVKGKSLKTNSLTKNSSNVSIKNQSESISLNSIDEWITIKSKSDKQTSLKVPNVSNNVKPQQTHQSIDLNSIKIDLKLMIILLLIQQNENLLYAYLSSCLLIIR